MYTNKRKKFTPKWFGVTIAIIAMLLAQSISPALAANETVTVNFALYGGAPTYRASGFIYGLSADASTPPQTLLSQIKVKNMRAGGSQVGCPNGGWINGQYTPRWDFVKAYYAKARAVGSRLSVILAALWGSDGVCNVPSWPGDNGNWTQFDNFLTQVINDAKANGMTGSDVRWDIWNEPDIFFWGASQSQYLQMWGRAVNRIRSEIPNAVIEGPSMSATPSTSNSWWNAYLDYVAANNVAPNILSWHALPGDPVQGANTMNSMLSSRGISVNGYSINEYGAFGDEQQPGPSAWYIARLERANGGVDGARANWGMVGQTPSLHDTMGWLVTPLPANQPMGQWWVYKRYADQTGLRTDLTPSASVDGVVFQDSSAQKSITLLGKKVGGGTGTVTVQYNNIPSWLIGNGTAHVLVERMPSTNAYVSAPTVVTNSSMTVSNNSLAVNINWSNALDAYAVTLTPGSGGGSCTPSTITPYVQVNGGSWQQTSSASLNVGDTVKFGPQPTASSGWSWSGPNGFGASTREVTISNIQTNQAGNYVATYTNTSGCSSNQTFSVTVAGGGGGGGTTYVKLQNRATGLMIDGMGRTSNGDNAGQWSSSSSYNQQWQVVSAGSYVKLQNRATGLYLDGMGRTSNGSAAGQWSSSSSYNQQWSESSSGGYTQFQNRATGLYLDGMGRTSNGSDLGQWSSSSSYNQQWAIEPQ